MYTPSITIDDVIDALGDFLEPICSSYEIVRAQVNRVPMPLGPCVILTELLQTDLETPIVNNDDPALNIVGPKRIDVQIDIYGPTAGDQCAAIKTVYRTPWATEQFSDGIKPLYCSDGTQSPLITGELQYENRWTITATLQYNPVVTVPQEFADNLEVDEVIAADIIYE